MTTILRLTRPLYLAFAALAYILGVSLADYLAIPFDAAAFWLGLFGVILAQTAMSLLAEVFRPTSDPLLPEETFAQRKSLRDSLLYISYGALAALAVICFVLYVQGHMSPQALLFEGLSLLLVLILGVPPVRLISRGFGELALATHLGYIIPSLGFLLQAGEYHRLLGVVTFPLTALGLACLIALSFQTFAQDRKFNRRTLLVSVGWERAVPLHNILIVATYFIFLASILLGFSFGLLWPAFLTLPFALLQIALLRNIAAGNKPAWTPLTVTAIAVHGLTIYFLIWTFWLR
jgi:1,4-dihydroxy-2-naphthoate polyprenyltransferase